MNCVRFFCAFNVLNYGKMKEIDDEKVDER